MSYSPRIGTLIPEPMDEKGKGPSMAKTRFNLPKDGAIEPDGARERVDGEDVEGHGLPITVPSLGTRVPGHGGENIPTPMDDEDDVEGHRARS